MFLIKNNECDYASQNPDNECEDFFELIVGNEKIHLGEDLINDKMGQGIFSSIITEESNDRCLDLTNHARATEQHVMTLRKWLIEGHSAVVPVIKNDLEYAMSLLQFTDFIGYSDLKIFVEIYVDAHFLESSNAVSLFAFSCQLNLPLLMESSLKIIWAKNDLKIKMEALKEMKGKPEYLHDFISYFFFNTTNQNFIKDEDPNKIPAEALTVTSLRKILYEKKMSIDGNRKILEDRVKEEMKREEQQEKK